MAFLCRDQNLNSDFGMVWAHHHPDLPRL
ncbi:unnamed protein product [Acanthoscelides obtectus]|uniref:Uncharacterized protein n=1 Tax=Acanthoscelides obtectus TaxID=200917 RepID=A0A9P0LLL7_ACAOB|nr:unnamed protein product [Acanthoscelides obtectus]CAK1681787.1 hypothetical protein AOBTE_LOCUS33271 [Acanthoscelides obtectus]